MKYVVYFRVSTKRQGESGLGLDAQRAAVAAFLAGKGAEVAGEYVEVESGKRADRPELTRALAHARRAKATLLVAKIDRLARNLHFLTGLQEAGVEFCACDMPGAGRFVVHVLAALAEHERELISSRTKAALQAAKRRGVLLGSARPGHWTGKEAARLEGARLGAERGLDKAHQAVSLAAREAYADLRPRLVELHAGGASLRQIAARLNAEGHRTRRGAEFSAVQVRAILSRE